MGDRGLNLKACGMFLYGIELSDKELSQKKLPDVTLSSESPSLQ